MIRSNWPLIVGIVIVATLTSPVNPKALKNDEEFRVIHDSSKTQQGEVVISCNSQLSNDSWSRFPGDKLNLSSIRVMKFSDCLIPESVNLRDAVMRSLNISSVDSLHLENPSSSLSRRNLDGLSVGSLTIIVKADSLPADVFHDVSGAKSLNVIDTELTSIPRGFFDEWTRNLHNVNLIRNRLRKIGRHDFAGLETVRIIWLNSNEISEIESGAFDELTSLRALDISHNRLRRLPADLFRRLRSLERVHLGINHFDELPAELLTGIDDCHLQSFRMSYNNGSLITMPDGFFRNLKFLKFVELVHNGFTSLPSDLFAGVNSLEKLDLSENKLISLPSGFFQDVIELVELRIMNNQLEYLPSYIFRLYELEKLYLNGNRLTNISSNIFGLMFSLKVLEVDWNNISYVDTEFCGYVPELQEIELSGNQLTLEGSHGKSALLECRKLKKLRASHNKIPKIYNDWMTLPVELIDLRYNEVTEFEIHQLAKLHQEVTVFLQNNKISTIDLRGLGNVTENAKVFLGNNPLNCDCRLKDFFRYFENNMNKNVENYVEIYADLSSEIDNEVGFEGFQCVSPNELLSRNITDIRSENLKCSVEAGTRKESTPAVTKNF